MTTKLLKTHNTEKHLKSRQKSFNLEIKKIFNLILKKSTYRGAKMTAGVSLGTT